MKHNLPTGGASRQIGEVARPNHELLCIQHTVRFVRPVLVDLPGREILDLPLPRSGDDPMVAGHLCADIEEAVTAVGRDLLNELSFIAKAGVWGEFVEPLTRMLLAFMTSAIPAAKNAVNRAYVEAIIGGLAYPDEEKPVLDMPAVRGYSPLAVALATSRLAQTMKFAPAPVEVIEEARKARNQLLDLYCHLWRLHKHVASARELCPPVCRWPEDDPAETTSGWG